MKSKIKTRMCNDMLNWFSFNYSQYENQISFGDLDYSNIENLHNLLRLFRPDAHCVIGDDSNMGVLIIYMSFSPLKDNENMNDLFKSNIETQDSSLNISFKKNYDDVSVWINNLLINKNNRTDILAKKGLIKEIKNDLPKGKLICCLNISVPMDDLFKNCVELLQYQ